MNEELKMSISPAMGEKGQKTIYVMFQDATRYLEIRLPDYKVVRNDYFTDEEVSQIILYTKSEAEHITELARGLNPVKALMS